METRKHRFSKRVGTSLGDPAMPSATAFVMKDSGPDAGDGPVLDALEVDTGGRRPSFPAAGLKPIADELRSTPPFGSPRAQGQGDQARRNTGGNARSQVDLLHSGTDAPVSRQGRCRDQSPLRLRGYMDGPALLATIPPLAALREARLSGLPGVLAVVRRHYIGGSRRRVSDTSPAGLLDASNEVEPVYPLGPHSVSPLRRLAGGRAPCDPRNGNGAA